MKGKKILILLFALTVGVLLIFLGGNKFLPFLVPFVFAHCDTMNGPVIQDAQKALETGNIDLVLKWVKKDDESTIRKAFEKTREVRNLSPKAKELADMYFFETLVRIHRAGEGASFTGIQPAGAEVEPGIEAADKAVETGNGEQLAKDVSEHIAKTIRERFNLVMEKKKHMGESVEAGREYVEAYVTFIHYVEKLHQLASAKESHHGKGVQETSHKQHEH